MSREIVPVRRAEGDADLPEDGLVQPGTSGVKEAGDATLREEIEKAGHLMFTSSAKQRDFWLGRGKTSSAELIERYGGLKPCIWGCDAHELARVGKPEEDRFCWIKGVPAFDTLRQAVIDPERAYVGAEPPMPAAASQIIDRIAIENAPWAQTPLIHLNPGLVAVIGARGSGKTALVDMIAAGCDSYQHSERPSFLARAATRVRLRTEAQQTWPSPRHDRLGSRVVNLSRLQASRNVAARVLASSEEAFDTPLGPSRSLAMPGACYSALRRLPRRDLHPLETGSGKKNSYLLDLLLLHDAPCTDATNGASRCKARAVLAIVINAMLRRIAVDAYILDSLMPDLVGHDRQPSAFLVYLCLYRQSKGRVARSATASLQQIASDTGLSKSAVQQAIRTLKRRRLVQSRQATATSAPDYLVAMPWVRGTR